MLVTTGAVLILVPRTPAQPPAPNAQQLAARNATEKELEAIAIVERKIMVPMRDGKRMATDVYRPKDTSKKYPIIFVRTPYNFNFWDVRNGAPRDMSAELAAVKRGYAFVEMNERGHFFSEGIYDILGAPLVFLAALLIILPTVSNSSKLSVGTMEVSIDSACCCAIRPVSTCLWSNFRASRTPGNKGKTHPAEWQQSRN